MKVKRVELKVLFDVWEEELEVDEVAEVITRAVDKAGYGLYDIVVVNVVDAEVEI